MSRVWSSGFELNHVGTTEWTAVVVNAPSTAGATVRSGSYAMRISSLGSTANKGLRYQFLASEAANEHYFRFYVYFVTFPGAVNRIAVWNDSTTVGSSPGMYLTCDASGVLRLYDEDGQITGTTTLSTSTWYRIELHFSNTGGAGACVVEARVDGAAAFASSSTRSVAATNSPIHFFLGGNLNGEANTTGDWSFDDVAINNTSGSFQNSWPGEGEIIHLRPNEAGVASDWTNDWQAVDEVTPNDATDLVASNTLNHIDDHGLAATPAAMESNDVINVVAVGVRYNGAGSSANASFVTRITAGGNTEESAAITPASTTWVTNGGAGVGYQLTLYDLPGASTTPWTKSDLDSAQGGYRLSAASTNNAQISAVWVLVDHKPAVVHEASAALAGSATVTPAAVILPFKEPFTGSEGALSGVWATHADFNAVRKNGSGIGYNTIDNQDAVSIYTGSPLSADQYAQIVIKNTTPTSGVVLRAEGISGTSKLYAAIYASDVGQVQLWYYNGSSWGTALATALATFAVDDVLRAEVVGWDFVIKKNGTTVLSFTETNHYIASGYVGIDLYDNVATIDDWEGGEVSATTREGVATLSGSGTVTAAGSRELSANAALNGTGAITPAGSQELVSAAALSASGSITSVGSFQREGIAALSASGSVTAVGTFQREGAATLSGSGAITPAGSCEFVSAATLNGTGSITPAGSLILEAAKTLTGSGAVTAAGEVTAGGTTHEGAAVLSGSGAITPAGSRELSTAATLSASGSVTAVGSFMREGVAVLSASGSITPAGSRELVSATTLNGTGSIIPAGSCQMEGAATLSGSGAITPAGSRELVTAAALNATGSIAAVGTVQVGGTTHEGAAELVGSGTVAAAGSQILEGATILSASGNVTVAGSFIREGAVALSGSGVLAAAAVQDLAARAALTGEGQISVEAVAIYAALVILVGSGTFSAVGTVEALDITSTFRDMPRRQPRKMVEYE